MKHYLEATSNCLYGNGCESEEKLFYTRRQRKCKMAVMGITTFISIAAVVLDWYNFVQYNELTHQGLIFTEDAATNAIYWSFMALCIINTLFLVAELVAFVLQLKYTRIYDAPVTRSEFMEEIVSAGLLLFQNMGIPLLFIVGMLMGMCPINALIRSSSGRMALLVAAFSSLWRFVQSFAYCFVCRQDMKLPCCQALRGFRAFFIAISVAVICFLLCVSFSLDISLRVDKYNGRYHGERFSDSMEGVFLYQRLLTPYSIAKDSGDQTCSFLETRVKVAKATDLENIHNNMYTIRFKCSEISNFYASFIDEQHRPLMPLYNCSIVIAIYNNEVTSARIINAIYELRDPQSSTCISGPVTLVLDSNYDPGENYAVQAAEVWSDKAVRGMVQNLCEGNGQNSCKGTNKTYSHPVFNCTSTACATSATDANNRSSVALVSHLLVSERQLLSYYPCMAYVDLHHQLDFNSCQASASQEVQDSSGMEEGIIEYGSCFETHWTSDELAEDWAEEESSVMDQYN